MNPLSSLTDLQAVLCVAGVLILVLVAAVVVSAQRDLAADAEGMT